MMEYPFYHDGMTIDEWYEERDYYANHMDDVKKGKYKPLWKQGGTWLHMNEKT